MEVYEKINTILKQKKMTKRDFAKILRDLEPRLKSTDLPPLETTIYKYLNGQVSIPIEIITYIAEALDITEQELFDDSLKTKIKYVKHISKDSDAKEIEYLNKFVNSNISNFIQSNNSEINIHNENNYLSDNKKIQKLISLLVYAPEVMLDNIIDKLEEIEKISSSFK
jgi:transcriptional regulator with XRE-family HTH domain